MTPPMDRPFGPYRLMRRLGGGGMGEVYLARTADDREVALKLIEMHEDEDSRAIVAAERLGAQLQQQFGRVDPHVPAVYDMGEAAGCFFIEMEYVDGHDLAELIPGGMSPESAAAVAADVAAFLEQAHGFSVRVEDREFRALVHADLKPKNIRLNSRHQVKVLDFGISKGLSLTGRMTTAAFGSRSYMSPEWLDTGRLDHHVDLWALGVVLYEMLAGHPPFKTENPRQFELALRARTPPLPLPDRCPDPLRRIVLKALAPDLRSRYQTAAAFRSDLGAWLAGRETAADREFAAAAEGDVTRRTGRSTDPAEAAEVTRRTTGPAAAEDEATVRTSAPPLPPLAAPARPPEDAPTTPTWWNWWRRWRSAVLLGAAVLLVGNEYAACQTAAALRADLPTREDATLDAAWATYQRVENRSLLGVARRRVDDEMADALVTHANRVIADFRQDRPTVRERQWQQARAWLASALRVHPSDATLVARLRYCEGHLSRIDGEARLREGQQLEADRRLHDAVSRFDEAARQDRAWPDPWLGLLRTYIHGLGDLEKAVSALNEAERRGYRAGRREFAQLADAHYAQADRARRECERLPLDSACGCLQHSARLYRSAVSWFDRAAGHPEASRGLVRAHAGLAQIEEREALLACDAGNPDAEP